MTELEILRQAHSADLQLLDEAIHRQLNSGSALMNAVVTSQLRTKGKQIRPLVVILCAGMFGPVTDKVIAAAAAVELLHNASLIHDDVVDASMTRRNHPTINSVWDNHIAVLVGDFYTSGAMQQAISTGDIRIVDALCHLGKELSLGEIDQIYNAREHCLTEETYFNIIDCKTASLFVACARMGCYASGIDDSRMETLAEFAHLLGRCFQLRDDVFDYYDAATVGKPTGNDLREGKVTLPLLHAMDVCPEAGVAEILAKGELTDDEISGLLEFARQKGGIDYTFEVMQQLRGRAAALLDTLPDSPQREELLRMFDFVIERTF